MDRSRTSESKRESSAIYRGATLDGVRHGEGTYNYPYGGNSFFTYRGNWIAGKKEGHGTFTMSDLSQYVGQFSNGEMTGEGIRKWCDKRVYEGEFLLGSMHGYGKWSDPTKNESYKGDFFDGKRHGKGHYCKGRYQFIGQFAGHKFNGLGMFSSNSFSINGRFVNGIIQNEAIAEWSELATLKSTAWKDGKVSGNGVYRALDGSYTYQGPWKNSLPADKDSNVAGYFHASLDRSAAAAQEEREKEAALDPKAKKAPPAKGKAEIDSGAPIIVPAGRVLGGLLVRSGTEKAIAEAAAAVPDPKAKGKDKPGAPPPSSGVPIPPAQSVPFESCRRVRVALRRRDDSGELTGPIPFWERKLTCEEASNFPARFPPNGVFFHGNKEVERPACYVAGQPSNLSLESATDCTQDECGVLAHHSVRCGSVSFNVQASEIQGAYDELVHMLDYKLDIKAISETFIKAQQDAAEALLLSLAESATIEAGEGEAMKENPTCVSDNLGPESDDAIPLSSSPPPTVEEPPAFQYCRVPMLTLKRTFDGTELDSSLVLSLCIPREFLNQLKEYIDGLARMQTEPSSDPGEIPLGEAATSEVPLEPSIEEPLSEPRCTSGLIWELNLTTSGPAGELTSSLCAAWKESQPLGSLWHSIALTISAEKPCQLIKDGISMDTLDYDGGLVTAWLPHSPAPAEITPPVEGAENEERENLPMEPTTPRMVLRAGGAGYCGSLKTIGLCGGAYIDAKVFTAVFASHRDFEDGWTGLKARVLEAAKDTVRAQRLLAKEAARAAVRAETLAETDSAAQAVEMAAEGAAVEAKASEPMESSAGDVQEEEKEEDEEIVIPSIPEDSLEVLSSSIMLCFGEGVLPSGRLMVPNTALPGAYVVEVSDDVTADCRILESTDYADLPAAPESVERMVRVASGVEAFKIDICVLVESM